jgi:signal transduction histidine kinase/CheY-like chemotaxis protein
MASHANAALLIGRSIWLGAVLARLSAAPVPLTLDQAASRAVPDFAPAYAHKTVIVKGVVAAGPVSFLEYQHLPIQAGAHGLTLEGVPPIFDKLIPGDHVEATGTIVNHAGLPVLAPISLKVLFHAAAPAPRELSSDKLRSFDQLGLLVTTEGRVIEKGATTSGIFLLIGNAKNAYKIYVPYSPQNPQLSFSGIAVGDRVRATGISSQYCPTPPYDRWFQLVAGDLGAVIKVGGAPWFDPWLVATLLATILCFGAVWWTRERRLRSQREVLTAAHDLSEEILGLTSTVDILKRSAAVLPRILHATGVRLYVYNRGRKMLDEVQTSDKGEPLAVSVDAPGAGIQAGIAACFVNRTQLAVPDTSRSPFADAGPKGAVPKSLLFIPLIAQGDVIGVLELDQKRRTRALTHDERTLAQHLGNQIGLAIQLLGQRTVREQLFRTEKLAAVGRLISGIVNELQAPLATISKVAESAIAVDPYSAADRELRVISSEARRSADIVTRLLAFAGGDQVEAKPMDINRLLRSLIEFREREWKVRGIRVNNLLASNPLIVTGSQGQLEQVLLNLLVYAEQSLSEVSDKTIVVRTTLLAKRVLIEIGFTESEEAAKPTDPFSKWAEGAPGALGLGVCRSIIAGHGGEVRLVQTTGSDSRFEIDLPSAAPETRPVRAETGQRDRSVQRTALLLEPDDPIQKQLMTLLSSRGYRVVPAQNSDVGLDMAQRLRFDIVFCSIRIPGLNWVELSERFEPLVGSFVLVSDGYDPDLAINFEGVRRFVLSKPIDEAMLDRVLAFAENPRRRTEAIAG